VFSPITPCSEYALKNRLLLAFGQTYYASMPRKLLTRISVLLSEILKAWDLIMGA
jgi:hypothetical protein